MRQSGQVGHRRGSERDSYRLSVVPRDYVETIRSLEIEVALESFPNSGLVVELGAGSGYQAACLAERGFEVIAMDIAERPEPIHAHFPVMTYDGVHIPLEDSSVDVVFSSHVLEHVQDLRALLHEVRRVLRDDGVGVHVVPTPAWRIWATLASYSKIPEWTFRGASRRLRSRRDVRSGQTDVTPASGSVLSRVRGMILPGPHGTARTAFSEVYTFRAKCWRDRFARAGLFVRSYYKTGLFYTGVGRFARYMTPPRRRAAARWLGSSSHVFVVSRPTIRDGAGRQGRIHLSGRASLTESTRRADAGGW
jgi:SAM-dependent methyltransferase